MEFTSHSTCVLTSRSSNMPSNFCIVAEIWKKGKDYYSEIERKHQCWKLLNLISVLFEIILKDKDDCLDATKIMQEIKSWNANP